MKTLSFITFLFLFSTQYAYSQNTYEKTKQ